MGRKQTKEMNTVGYFSTSLTPYYSRNGITIFLGDCLEVMPRLEGVFDAIVTDLPYG